MNLLFFSLPAHRISLSERIPANELLEPTLPKVPGALESALAGAEFRGLRAQEKLRSLLQANVPAELPPPLSEFTASALFAQPPADLPALLRLADQLETLAQQDEGEKALVWNCQKCGTRYAVPAALVRPVSIRCERCGEPVALFSANSPGEEQLVDPEKGAISQARRVLAGFFREAMARGWPVVVCAASSEKEP